MPTLVEVREEIAAKSKDLAAIFEQAGSDLDLSKAEALKGLADGAARAAEVKRLNDELTALGVTRDGLAELEAIGQNARNVSDEHNKPATRVTHPGGKSDAVPAVRSLKVVLAESKQYQTFRSRGGGTAVIELTPDEFKALLTLGDINNPATRLPGIVESAQESVTVRDLMLDGSTDNNSITYMEETTFTNGAVETAEGTAKGEAALDFTERTDNVRKIATWLPATTELLADVKGIQSYIEGRLRFMVKRREELQLLVGDGTAPNISGILDRVGIQTQAKGADPTPDAVYKAMTKIMVVGQADPTAAVFHPNDWQDIRLLKTADGIYIWGSPADVGPMRIWGLAVRATSAMTENTALVGAFKPYAQIFQREGITVTISTEHASFFVENKVAILAEERLALAVYRPAAFATVTGI